MSRLALITYLDGKGDQPVDPGYGQPAPPVYPSQGLPGYGRPDNSLPGLPPGAVTLPVFPWDPTRPDNSLPGSGGRPDNSLPGEGGERPDNSLPGGGVRPDQGLPRPGRRYIVKWLACVGLILVPDNSLPETAEPK